MSDVFAPPGGWRVRIIDLSGGAENNISEEVGGFPTLMQANAFARRYVRDSVEMCRAGGLDEQRNRAFPRDLQGEKMLARSHRRFDQRDDFRAKAQCPSDDPGHLSDILRRQGKARQSHGGILRDIDALGNR